jgi:PKD repeat protein
MDGMKVHHTYTEPGEYRVRVTVTSLDAVSNAKTVTVSVSGDIPTRFVPADKKRPE